MSLHNEESAEDQAGVILSASRRTDMARYFGDILIGKLKRHPPGAVHTIVLWTKDPSWLLARGGLGSALAAYDQLFVHYTITGMGSTPLEPRIPTPERALSLLGPLIELVGSPERVRIRFDPIVNLRIAGRPYTNLEEFESVACAGRDLGVKHFIASWLEPYDKVLRRFADAGVELDDYDRSAQAAAMIRTAERLGVELGFCCMEGLVSSECISGRTLERLHPRGRPAPKRKAPGQRKLCECTVSLDLGDYSLACPGGCLYCYANPRKGKQNGVQG